MPRIRAVAKGCAEIVSARSCRDACFSLGGTGVTQAKVQELREAHAYLRSFYPMLEAVRSRNAVRLMRYREAGPWTDSTGYTGGSSGGYGGYTGGGYQPRLQPRELVPDDVVVEVRRGHHAVDTLTC